VLSLRMYDVLIAMFLSYDCFISQPQVLTFVIVSFIAKFSLNKCFKLNMCQLHRCL
jgi:hypothetical protein